MSIADTVKDIKPTQWALIAGAGIGLGLLLRMRSKSKGTGAVVPTSTDTPDTLNDTQGFGNFSGTGQTGWAGGAIINPNQQGQAPTTPVDTIIPQPIAAAIPPTTIPSHYTIDPYVATTYNGYMLQGGKWVPIAADTPTLQIDPSPTSTDNDPTKVTTYGGYRLVNGQWVK